MTSLTIREPWNLIFEPKYKVYQLLTENVFKLNFNNKLQYFYRIHKTIFSKKDEARIFVDQDFSCLVGKEDAWGHVVPDELKGSCTQLVLKSIDI